MTFKTILVHCNDTRRIARMAEAAVQLGNRFAAHLIGLSVAPPMHLIPAGMPGNPDVIVSDERCRAYRARNPELMAAFLEVAGRGKHVTAEWREVDADQTSVSAKVLQFGLAADLLIAAQRDDNWAEASLLDVVDSLVMACGRPTLILPNEGLCSGLGKRILVAWNGRREAARAVFDALPLLQAAEAVRLLRFDASAAQEDGVLEHTDICTALTRHGVNCTRTEVVKTHASIGPALTQYAVGFRADLLVMGCYGHSRLREFVLGGASRHQLRHMVIPTLMSH